MTKSALIQHINNALAGVLALFGVSEVLFLAGLWMLFAGLAGLWSRDGALAVCGGVLVLVAVFGASSSSKKGNNPS